MALNLSTLTNPSTSAGILTDLAKSASNLDLVASLENRVSGGPNATQTTATYQPRAHVPVGGGHLYLPSVSGNSASVTFPTIAADDDFVLEMDVFLVDATDFHLVSGSTTDNRFAIYAGRLYFSYTEYVDLDSSLDTGSSTLTVERSGSTLTLKQDGVTKATTSSGAADNAYALTHLSFNGQNATSVDPLNGYIKTATLSIEGTEGLNIDFSNTTHKASSFVCSTGQTVTINTSGNDPATIVRRPFIRLDGARSFLNGSFNESNTTGGYMFVVYSVNGDGGEESGRVFVMNSAGEQGFNNNRSFLWSLRKSNTNNLGYYHENNWRGEHTLGFDLADGVMLHEIKVVAGSQVSKINNGDIQTSSLNLSSLSSEEFDIGSNPAGASNPAIDIEALYLFDETLTDDEATQVRDYLNSKSSIY